MRTRILVASFCVLVGTTLAIVYAQAPGGNAADEQAIRKANDAFEEAFNKGNLDVLTNMWTNDGEYVDDEGKSTKGRDKIGLLFKEQLAALKGHTLKLKTLSVRLIKPDVAFEDGIAEVVSPDGQSDVSKYVSVWTKTDGKWQLARSQDLPGDVDATADSNYKRLKELEWLIGDWSAESKEKEATVALSARWIKDKNFIEQNYSIKTKDDDEKLSVTVIIGWDPSIGQIRSWFFDSKGGHGGGTWTREGRKWLSQTTGVTNDGRDGSSVNSLEFVDDNAFLWRSQDREISGNVMPDVEVKFARKAATP
jgi:uncharacterized protein (TIGR02246 family)